jgi:ribosomal protein L18
MKLDKKQNRLRRARKVRAKISELEVNRLSVHRTPRHIYAQVIAPDGGTILVSASTLERLLRSLVHESLKRRRLQASIPLHLTDQVFAITGALRHWPMRHVKLD